jgi:hypothetical protein
MLNIARTKMVFNLESYRPQKLTNSINPLNSSEGYAPIEYPYTTEYIRIGRQ